ncbi:MAG TPA: hypothetical protein VHW23_04225 [Kofleriaceae bacterium]|nr:hypothetical protein [Kofleriaceae bacterium]
MPLIAEHLETMKTLNQVDTNPPRKQDLGMYVITDPRVTDYLVDFTPRTASVQLPRGRLPISSGRITMNHAALR